MSEIATKETALTVIEKAEKNNYLIFFDKTNFFPTVELYRTEVTEITINKDNDCFKISGKYMPKREMVDKIGEANGIIFTNGETKNITVNDPAAGKHIVFVGSAQGKVRMPDGTWRMSSICNYEFDPTLRAMLDYEITELTAETKKRRKLDKDGIENKFGNTLARAILEYQKTGRQRANTGARLRVIRELVAMPIAFTEDQIKKPVVFGRIVQNTSYILNTPEGKMMATAQALGYDVSGIFGGKKLLNDSVGQQNEQFNEDDENQNDDSDAAEAPTSNEPEIPDDPLDTAEQKETEFERLTHCLIEWQEAYRDDLNVKTINGKNPYKMIEGELARSDANEETRASMIRRIRDWLKEKGIKV